MTKKGLLFFSYAAVTIIAILCLFPKYSYNDPDTFWHIELGQYMIERGTVLHHAIHTFYGDRLPYVPHEIGFQIIIALFYKAFGWPGTYALTAISLFLLVLGLYRMTCVSRKESGLEQRHSVLFLLVLAVTACVYYYYFAMRPQMISAFLIVWFFVYLREFRMATRTGYSVLLVLLSLAVANVHTGVWLVVVVFTGMAVIEAWLEKNFDKRRALTFALVLLSGLANFGGLKSIFFILVVTRNNFNMRIDEWQPISFAQWVNFPRMLLLLAFVSILPFVLHRKPFRFMLMLGIVYLGVSNYKQNLFMWLFLPYFAATVVDLIPRADKLRTPWSTLAISACLAIGLFVNLALAAFFPTPVDRKAYPVEEMNYILQQHSDSGRPRVLAPYGVSGYVMFRGGDILCDGRQDPFITSESKGVFGWTAFERSMNGFSEYLPEIVDYDRPDYVVTRNNSSYKHFDEWVSRFGEPVFKGEYGNVFLTKGMTASKS